jgi:hypothetical protein
MTYTIHGRTYRGRDEIKQRVEELDAEHAGGPMPPKARRVEQP